MDKQRFESMLFIEKSYPSDIPIKLNYDRRLIANDLNKLTDDEHVSSDVFALAMNIFDRFILKTSSIVIYNRHYLLIALCCYNVAKKLRTVTSINNENEKTSLMFIDENYSEEEIFDTELIISNTLDWDLTYFVPHDYIDLLLKSFSPTDNQDQICLHVQILLSIAICELNTLEILPSLLACACLKAAIRGISRENIYFIDDLILKTINCNLSKLNRTQTMIEKLLEFCLHSIKPSPKRRCLGLIDTSSQQHKKLKTNNIYDYDYIFF